VLGHPVNANRIHRSDITNRSSTQAIAVGLACWGHYGAKLNRSSTQAIAVGLACWGHYGAKLNPRRLF